MGWEAYHPGAIASFLPLRYTILQSHHTESYYTSLRAWPPRTRTGYQRQRVREKSNCGKVSENRQRVAKLAPVETHGWRARRLHTCVLRGVVAESEGAS